VMQRRRGGSAPAADRIPWASERPAAVAQHVRDGSGPRCRRNFSNAGVGGPPFLRGAMTRRSSASMRQQLEHAERFVT